MFSADAAVTASSNRTVIASFNGTHLVAHPGTTPDVVRGQFNEQIGNPRKSKRYEKLSRKRTRRANVKHALKEKEIREKSTVGPISADARRRSPYATGRCRTGTG